MTHRADIYTGDRRTGRRYLDTDDTDQALALTRAGLTGDQQADVYVREELGGAHYVTTVGAER